MDADIVGIIFGCSVLPASIMAWYWGRAHVRKIERQPPASAISPEVMMRLERMEQGIESIALEVERISEGQRFTTKLLSEKGSPIALPAQEAK